jgi:hypothetical protein
MSRNVKLSPADNMLVTANTSTDMLAAERRISIMRSTTKASNASLHHHRAKPDRVAAYALRAHLTQPFGPASCFDGTP